jgi:hypothetical protein
MEEILSRLALPDSDLPSLLAELVARLRPDHAGDSESARRNLQALCHILSTRPELRSALRNGLTTLAQTYRHSELYTVTGILPNTGFVAEGLHRIGHTLLPEVLDPGLLRSVLRRAFDRPSDRRWVIGVGEHAWLQLLEAMRFDEGRPAASVPPSVAASALAARAVVLDRRLRHGARTAAPGTVARDLRIAFRRPEPRDDGLHRRLPGALGQAGRPPTPTTATCASSSASARK